MAHKVDSTVLDSFLATQTPTTPSTAMTTVAQGTPTPKVETPIQSATSLVSNSNNTMNTVVELLSGLNSLLENGKGFFNTAGKEKRLALDSQQQGGNYEQYVKDKMSGKPAETLRESPNDSLKMSDTQKTQRVYVWFQSTLEAIPKETTAEDIAIEWGNNKAEFMKILKDCMSEPTETTKWKPESNVTTADKPQTLKVEPLPEESPSSTQPVLKAVPIEMDSDTNSPLKESVKTSLDEVKKPLKRKQKGTKKRVVKSNLKKTKKRINKT